MKILCVIPSRMSSTRLAKKPLLPIQGKPMIQWVYENASRCKLLNEVVVATDDIAIATLIDRIGGTAIMTDPALLTGSDRVAAAAKVYPDVDIIINLQGDEPFIKPSMLEELVRPFFEDETVQMSTLAYPLNIEQSHQNPGAVKVITDLKGNALYFSRAPIPYFRIKGDAPVYNHIGLYAFRRDFLLAYTALPQTPLEKIESLEQLRVLEHGFAIRVALTNERTLEINTPEEYLLAQSFAYSD